jgi:quercetin dioxygenase-like cupin family protein
MKRFVLLVGSLALLSASFVFGQDAMQYGLKHLRVLAEDEKVRVLKYTPQMGDKTPMHSHPSTVVYVIKN